MSCSTSEKLRRLNGALDTDDLEAWEGRMVDLAEKMAEALPALIAVVEESEFYLREHTAGRPALTIGIERALAALDEALGEP